MEECSKGNEEESQSGIFVTDFIPNAGTDIILDKLQALSEQTSKEELRTFGTPENKTELEKKMSKLILCVEMENWEKAEMFADAVKRSKKCSIANEDGSPKRGL